MRGRLDRPVTEEERQAAIDPFAAWGGYAPATSDPRTRYYTRANIHTDYLRSRELAKELMLGIPFLVNLQDRAMTETMGPIYDRTQEHLGTTDAMVIFMRRRLLDAARALREQGVVPANVDDAVALSRAPGVDPAARRRELDRGDREGAPVRRRRADRVGTVRLTRGRSGAWLTSDARVHRSLVVAARGRRPRAGDGRGTGPGAAPSLAGRAPAGRHRRDS